MQEMSENTRKLFTFDMNITKYLTGGINVSYSTAKRIRQRKSQKEKQMDHAQLFTIQLVNLQRFSCFKCRLSWYNEE